MVRGKPRSPRQGPSYPRWPGHPRPARRPNGQRCGEQQRQHHQHGNGGRDGRIRALLDKQIDAPMRAWTPRLLTCASHSSTRVSRPDARAPHARSPHAHIPCAHERRPTHSMLRSTRHNLPPAIPVSLHTKRSRASKCPPARSSPPSLRQTPPRWAGDKPRPRSPPRPRLPRPTPARARCPMRADRPHEKIERSGMAASRRRAKRPVRLIAVGIARRQQASGLGGGRFHNGARIQQADRLQHEQKQEQKRRDQHRRLNRRLGKLPISALSTGICR